MYLSLSNRQHPMLSLFAKAAHDWYMTVAEAQTYDQRPFRSMLIHEWIAYRPGRGFHITETGREAWKNYISTGIFRSAGQVARPLTAYFDANVYGLRVVVKAKRKTA